MADQLAVCEFQTEQRLEDYGTAFDNASIYSTSLWQRLDAVTSFDAATSPHAAMLVTSFNRTSALKRLAEVAWTAIQSSAETVENADVIVQAMAQRVASAVTSLTTSRTVRADVNTTLNDLQPVDISADLATIGTVSETVFFLLYIYD